MHGGCLVKFEFNRCADIHEKTFKDVERRSNLNGPVPIHMIQKHRSVIVLRVFLQLPPMLRCRIEGRRVPRYIRCTTRLLGSHHLSHDCGTTSLQDLSHRHIMEGKQLSTFVIALVSLIVTTLVVLVRCFVRKSINGLGLDDWSMVVGQVWLSVILHFFIRNTNNGKGPLCRYLHRCHVGM